MSKLRFGGEDPESKASKWNFSQGYFGKCYFRGPEIIFTRLTLKVKRKQHWLIRWMGRQDSRLDLNLCDHNHSTSTWANSPASVERRHHGFTSHCLYLYLCFSKNPSSLPPFASPLFTSVSANYLVFFLPLPSSPRALFLSISIASTLGSNFPSRHCTAPYIHWRLLPWGAFSSSVFNTI